MKDRDFPYSARSIHDDCKWSESYRAITITRFGASACCFDSGVWAISWRKFKSNRGGDSFREEIGGVNERVISFGGGGG